MAFMRTGLVSHRGKKNRHQDDETERIGLASRGFDEDEAYCRRVVKGATAHDERAEARVSHLCREGRCSTLETKKKGRHSQWSYAEDDIVHQSHRSHCICVRTKVSCCTGFDDRLVGVTQSIDHEPYKSRELYRE